MGEIAITIDTVFWFFTVVLLITSLLLRLDSSSLISLAIWVIANLAMLQIQSEIMSLSSSIGGSGRGIWYLTWASIDALAIWCIYIMHARNYLLSSKLTNFIVFAFFSLCLLQCLRYIDRSLLETDILASVYKYGIIAINISVVPVTAIWLLSSFKTHRKEALHG